MMVILSNRAFCVKDCGDRYLIRFSFSKSQMNHGANAILIDNHNIIFYGDLSTVHVSQHDNFVTYMFSRFPHFFTSCPDCAKLWLHLY